MSHPVACAAALAAVETIEEDGLLDAVTRRGEELRQALEARFGQHPHVGDIRGRGLLQAMEFVQDRESKQPFGRELRLAETLKLRLRQNGLIAYPSAGTADGVAGDHLLLAPPYIVTSEHIGMIVDIVGRTLDEILDA
jgi:adenosylmethionine-8-amino-7-oxononanoate aminotransferase